MVGILNRVGMFITTTGQGSVTANTLISNKFLSPAEAGAVNGQQYYFMLEEGSDFELFIGTWTSSGTMISRDTVLASKIGGVAGTTKLTLAGNAALRSISPKEAFQLLDKAAGSDLRTGTDDAKYLTSKSQYDAAAAVASNVTGSTTLDFAAGINFALTLTGNLTLAVPSNMKNGQSGVIYFIQDGTGSRTISLNASIKKFGTYTLSTAAGAIDRCGYFVRGGVLELTALEKGLA